MEWVLVSLAIVGATFGSTGAVMYYYHRFNEQHIRQRMLQQKQLEIYEDITQLMCQVKSSLAYASGDETLSQWKQDLMIPLRQMLSKTYQWSIFLPDSIGDLPEQYAGKVASSLKRLDGVLPNELASMADIIAEIRQVEADASRELRRKIREAIGA